MQPAGAGDDGGRLPARGLPAPGPDPRHQLQRDRDGGQQHVRARGRVSARAGHPDARWGWRMTTALISVETVLLLVLLVLVAGLLRSHAEILRRLDSGAADTDGAGIA